MLFAKWILASLVLSAGAFAAQPAAAVVTLPESGFEFIDTSFENASPVWY